MGFDTDLFVQQPVDENLVCHICFDVMEQPTTCCDNGHTFCLACLETWEEVSESECCPDCREPMTETSSCRPLNSIIFGLQVRCPRGHTTNSAKPSSSKRARLTLAPIFKHQITCCPWVGSLESYLDKHKGTECDFEQVECSLCKKMVVASSMKRHKEHSCDKRLVECRLCHQSIVASEMKNHEETTCPESIVTCNHCGDQVRRGNLGQIKPDPTTPQLLTFSGHKRECRDLIIPCVFNAYGCKTHCQRKSMEAHRKKCAEHHTELLAMAMKKMEDDSKWQHVGMEWEFPRSKIQQLKAGQMVLSSRVTTRSFVIFLVVQRGGANSHAIHIKLCVTDQSHAVAIDRVAISVKGDKIYHSDPMHASVTMDPERINTGLRAQVFARTMWSVDGGKVLTLPLLESNFGSKATLKLSVTCRLAQPGNNYIVNCIES